MFRAMGPNQRALLRTELEHTSTVVHTGIVGYRFTV